MNDNGIVEEQRRERIAALYPEMVRRAETLRGLLARMMAGEDVPDHVFDLARCDLLAVLEAMLPGDPDAD